MIFCRGHLASSFMCKMIFTGVVKAADFVPKMKQTWISRQQWQHYWPDQLMTADWFSVSGDLKKYVFSSSRFDRVQRTAISDPLTVQLGSSYYYYYHRHHHYHHCCFTVSEYFLNGTSAHKRLFSALNVLSKNTRVHGVPLKKLEFFKA